MACTFADVAHTGLFALLVMEAEIGDITVNCAAAVAYICPSHLHLSRNGRHRYTELSCYPGKGFPLVQIALDIISHIPIKPFVGLFLAHVYHSFPSTQAQRQMEILRKTALECYREKMRYQNGAAQASPRPDFARLHHIERY
jgi:hypothetical protein